MTDPSIRRGDIFWLHAEAIGVSGATDASDQSQGSVPGTPHPHVVIQDDVLNRSRIPTVVVCALTSNLKRANEPGNVLLDVGEGNLPRQSVLVVSQVSVVEKSRLGAAIGSLSRERVDQVLAGLRFQQASYFRHE